MNSFLALDKIKPGDVILSSARTKTSIGIRAASFSRVSHAAIAIHPLIWFEALGSGIQYTIHRPTFVLDDDGLHFGLPVPRGERYIVKRPKEQRLQGRLDEYRAAKNLIEASSKFAFLNYAVTTNFLQLARFGLGKRAFARLVTEVMDARRSKLFPGPFCSWLVAECYNGIGWDIFAGELNRLSPRALDKSKRLGEVNGTILNSEAFELRPVFRQYQQQMRFSIVMGQRNINTVMSSATQDKEFSDFNEHMKNLTKRFEQIMQVPVPEHAREQAEIEMQLRKQFEQSQQMATEAISLTYTSAAVLTEELVPLSECRLTCKKAAVEPYHKDLCDQMGMCARVSEIGNEANAEIYQIFPRPKPPPKEWLASASSMQKAWCMKPIKRLSSIRALKASGGIQIKSRKPQSDPVR